MTLPLVPCPGCGAMVSASDGPTHRYLGASPGCWAIFGEILAEEYESTRNPRTLRLAVDAYAAQHPGTTSPQATRSVAFHLTRLCLVVEFDVAAERVPLQIGPVLDRDAPLPWLDPPSFLSPLTVLDVRASSSRQDRARRADAWARSVWTAWAPHHPTVRRWAGQVRAARVR